jgi:MoaA/NifB/PqqE/SkfB family radical SAM enzyme
MAQLLIELTNRCNLRCQHCFAERHAGTGDLPMEILDQVLREGKGCGLERLSFTGGEPTLHRQFAEIVRRVCTAGYPFAFVSHGGTFPQIYPLLLEARPWFRSVTFSLDGAREATHDWQRGQGSYRRVLRAASICVAKDLPFTFNMVLTARNRHEVAEAITLAKRLGSRGLRFAHLMPTPDTAQRGLDLAPHERRAVEAEIWRLKTQAPLPVGLASGYFSEVPLFPCGPLTLQEMNLDYRGNLTLCCHLSGYAETGPGAEVVGNLQEMSLATACEQFRRRVAGYLADKRAAVAAGALREVDHFPCWYCVQYLGKATWLRYFPHHPWGGREPDDKSLARFR